MSLKAILTRVRPLISAPYEDLEELGFLPNRPYDSAEGRGVVSVALELLDYTTIVMPTGRKVILGMVDEPDDLGSGGVPHGREMDAEKHGLTLGEEEGKVGGEEEEEEERDIADYSAAGGLAKRYDVRIEVTPDWVSATCTCQDRGDDLNPCPHKVAVLAKAFQDGFELDDKEAVEAAHITLCLFVFGRAVKSAIHR